MIKFFDTTTPISRDKELSTLLSGSFSVLEPIVRDLLMQKSQQFGEKALIMVYNQNMYRPKGGRRTNIIDIQNLKNALEVKNYVKNRLSFTIFFNETKIRFQDDSGSSIYSITEKNIDGPEIIKSMEKYWQLPVDIGGGRQREDVVIFDYIIQNLQKYIDNDIVKDVKNAIRRLK